MLNYNKLAKHNAVILSCRIILGLVFIFASIDKILHPDAFAEILHNYKILPDFLIYAPTLFLPWIELIAGSFLIAGIFVRGSVLILNSLLLIFIMAITINLIRGITFDCGCFSTIPGESGSVYILLIRDLLLLIPGALLYLNYMKKRR